MEQILAKLAKIPLTQRVAIVLGVVILLVGLTYLVLVSPLQTKIDQAGAQLSKLEAQIAQKKAIADDLRRYKLEVERLKQRRNEAYTLLPKAAEIPELLQKIASLAEQSDLQMKQFEPQSEQNAQYYTKIPVKMALIGNYHSIAVFFDKVAKLARIVNVTDIKFTNPKIENKRVVLEADFLASTFKFVEKPAGAAAGKATAKPTVKPVTKAGEKAKAAGGDK